MTKNPNTRPLPDAPEYQLADDGRLYGPCGLLRPHVPATSRPRAARYSVMIRGAARTKLVRELMLQVWGVDWVPTQAWLDAVREEVAQEKQDRSYGAIKREKARAAARAKREARQLPEVEEWRCLPEEPRYELSNHGRLRGPMGLITPGIKPHGRPSSALYLVSEQRTGKSKGVMIRLAMGRIWDVDFEPTVEWVEQIRAEVAAAKTRPKLKVVKPKAAKPKKSEDPEARRCVDCNVVLTAGYWRRCPDCWAKVRGGFDMPLEEYGTAASNGRRR
jgi:hypothetical protein